MRVDNVASNICLSLDDGPVAETVTADSGQVQVQEGAGVVRFGRCFCGRAWQSLLATSQDAM